MQHKTGLGHWAFKGIDQQQNPIGHIQDAFHLAAKIGVAGGVDDVDFNILVNHRYVFGNNGDPAFAFQVVVVQNQIPFVFAIAEKLAMMHDFVHQRGFSVIDVGNNGNVPDVHLYGFFRRAKVGNNLKRFLLSQK